MGKCFEKGIDQLNSPTEGEGKCYDAFKCHLHVPVGGEKELTYY